MLLFTLLLGLTPLLVDCGALEQNNSGNSSDYLKAFFDRMVKNLNREEDPVVQEFPPWMVKSADKDQGYCLLASMQVRLELFRSWEGNGTMEEVNVPVSKGARKGSCKPGKSEVELEWHDKKFGEKNVLNLVVQRQSTNLARLGGAFLRLHNKRGHDEYYSSMNMGSFNTLVWPIRYQVRCSEPLSLVLTPVKKGHKHPNVTLHLIDLRIEAFRESTQHDGDWPQSVAPQWFRREWGCEFHRTFEWAPYLVAGGLTGLVLFTAMAFLCRNSMDKKPKKYDTFNIEKSIK